MYKELFMNKIREMDARFDESYGLLAEELAPWNMGGGGYHTRISGKVHGTAVPAAFAEYVYAMYAEEFYPHAERVLWKLCEIQDQDPESRTYGLWSYYAEEPCDKMIAPDYNWADFICRHLAFIMKKRAECLPEDLKTALKRAMALGAACSIRRNVGCDYTNISLMSMNTIVGAAEVNGDAEMMNYAKARLARVLAYNSFNGAFSEYNSPSYSLIALDETSRMLDLFEDPECRSMAEELNDIAWRILAEHFDSARAQLAPPHIRAYSDISNKQILATIYVGTAGEYGEMSEEYAALTRLPYFCPEKYRHFFAIGDGKRVVDETYYKKNRLRDPAEDLTIIRNIGSPDLRAMTEITPEYSMGAFRVLDTWVQRHNCMVMCGEKDSVAVMRLRCLKKDNAQKDGYEYDTCMGFVTADLADGVILGQASLTRDHGDFHYILDKVKDGKYECDGIFYAFTFAGDLSDLAVSETERGFRFAMKGITVDLCIQNAVFEGKAIKPYWDGEKNRLVLPLFDEHRIFDLYAAENFSFTFTMAVNREAPVPTIFEKDGVREASAGALCVRSYTYPTDYDTAVEFSAN